jgi:hypothetical protein
VGEVKEAFMRDGGELSAHRRSSKFSMTNRKGSLVFTVCSSGSRLVLHKIVNYFGVLL